MDCIKYMDFFGVNFHFYIHNQPNYRNTFGGIMTIIFCILCIAFFFIYNYNELLRNNPISTTSEFQFVSQKLVNFHKEKIWIPFRIVTDENKYIDHRNIMQIIPLHVRGEFDYNNGMNLKYDNLSYKLCNETSMANNTEYYTIDIPLDELFCIDQDNLTFGGDWNLHFTSYLEIGLYLCNGVPFNESDPKCSGLIQLMNSINSSLSFDLYYPFVQFQPMNYKNPISITYKNYYYRLSSFRYKIGKLYIQEHILSDDINLIYNDKKNKSFWGCNSFFSDSYSSPNEFDPLYKNNLHKSFILEIYIDTGIILYTRTYKKLFGLISDVFPFYDLILYVFKYFAYYIKLSSIKLKLAENIFEKKEIKQKKVFIKRFNNLEENYDNKNNLNIKIEKIIDKRFQRKRCMTIKNKSINKLSSINNQSNVGLEEENIMKILNKKEISALSKSKQNEYAYKNIKIIQPNNAKTYEDNKEYEPIFPFFYFFMDFFFDRLINPKRFCWMPKLYFTVYNFMCRIYDISTHILFFKQFNLSNNLLLEIISKGKKDYNSKTYYKINLNDEKIIQKINNDLVETKSFLY